MSSDPRDAYEALLPWQHGDIARVQRCVASGDPYWLLLMWSHPKQAWVNPAGTTYPLDPQPRDDEIHLLVRQAEPVSASDDSGAAGGSDG